MGHAFTWTSDLEAKMLEMFASAVDGKLVTYTDVSRAIGCHPSTARARTLAIIKSGREVPGVPVYVMPEPDHTTQSARLRAPNGIIWEIAGDEETTAPFVAGLLEDGFEAV